VDRGRSLILLPTHTGGMWPILAVLAALCGRRRGGGQGGAQKRRKPLRGEAAGML